jgi:hypothetical protein
LAKYLELCSFIHLAAFVPFMFVMAQQSLKSHGKGLDRQLIKEAIFRWGMHFFETSWRIAERPGRQPLSFTVGLIWKKGEANPGMENSL